MAEKPKLKPCPFCGHVPEFRRERDGCEIYCNTKACKVAPHVFMLTKKGAINAWNKRANP